MKSEFEKKCNTLYAKVTEDDYLGAVRSLEEHIPIEGTYCFDAIHDFLLTHRADIIDMWGGSEFLAEELKKREDVEITTNKPS